jgi:biopolymer transport protein ExbB
MAAEPERRPEATVPAIPELRAISLALGKVLDRGARWYVRTPASDRICWGGLMACGGLGLFVLAERMFRLRRRRIIPPSFTARFLDRLHEGKLDGGKALDYCEMNPSPAARVALAAVRRWGRPPADLERAVAMAHRVEADRLHRNVRTLRRIAVIAPLLGLLGTLTACGRILEAGSATSGGPGSWGPAVSGALSFLILGITIATLAVVAYDALCVRIERLSGSLDRLGAETIDAIAMSAPVHSPSMVVGSGPARTLEVHAGHVGMPGPMLATTLDTSQRPPSESRSGITSRAERESHC